MKRFKVSEAQPICCFNRVRNLFFLHVMGGLAVRNEELLKKVTNILKDLHITFDVDGDRIILTGEFYFSGSLEEIVIWQGKTDIEEVEA